MHKVKFNSQKKFSLFRAEVIGAENLFDRYIDLRSFPPPHGISYRPGRYTFEQLMEHAQSRHQFEFYFDERLWVTDLCNFAKALPKDIIPLMKNTQWDIYYNYQNDTVRFRPLNRRIMDDVLPNDFHKSLLQLIVLKQGPDGTYRSEDGWSVYLRKGLNAHSFWTLFNPRGLPVEYLGKQDHPQREADAESAGYVFEYYSYEQRTGKKLPT